LAAGCKEKAWPVEILNGKIEMAAHGGIRDKILRFSMPFEKKAHSTGKSATDLPQKGSGKQARFGSLGCGLKMRSWAAQLKEDNVHSCVEKARREWIT
jgi:hypothetical protein